MAVPNYMRGVSRGKVPDASQMARMKGKRNGTMDPVTRYQETIQKVVSDAIQQGQYTATQREIAAIKRNLQTRQQYLDAASHLRSEVGKLGDGRKQQLITIAAILEKEAMSLPIPKTPVQQLLEAEGKKRGLSIRTVLPKDLAEQLRSAFKNIDQRIKGQSAIIEKSEVEKGAGQEVGD